MTTNVGFIDRGVRVLVGLALIAFALALGYLAPGTSWSWVGWIGVVPLITGLVGVCPAYSLLGLSTCPMKRG